MSAPGPGWWTSFYDDTYADFWLTAHTEQAVATNSAIVEFLVRELELAPGDRIFDQCCGIGRIAIPLAKRELSVTGVDVMPGYLEQARAGAAAAGVTIDVHLGDAREFVTPVPCKAAFNWFTSFGYSHDDADNRRMLECAYASLVPGGKFALDHINLPRILLFRQQNVVFRQSLPEGGEMIIIDQPRFDFPAGMLRSRWEVIFPDGRRAHRDYEHRLYMPYDIVRLLEGAGFSSVRLVGSVAGEPFEQWGARLIAIATK